MLPFSSLADLWRYFTSRGELDAAEICKSKRLDGSALTDLSEARLRVLFDRSQAADAALQLRALGARLYPLDAPTSTESANSFKLTAEEAENHRAFEVRALE
jgi:hypothetical protein